MDLDTVAQELYGLPLDEFVATRNARAKQARADGDRELAADIQSLAKPTTAAWLVNQLSREHADDLVPLLELGRELRDASAKLDGDTLRTLGRQRNELVSELLDRVESVGAAHGAPPSEAVAAEVRQTLESSLSDSEIADAVAAGQLTRAVEYAGFGENVGLGGPTGIVGKPARERPQPKQPTNERPAGRATKRSAKAAAKQPSQPTDLTSRRRQRAERDVAEAAQRLEQARAAQEEAAEATRETASRLADAEAQAQRLRDELSAAEKDAKAARHADRSAQQRLTSAERELGGIERMHDRAKARLAELDD